MKKTVLKFDSYFNRFEVFLAILAGIVVIIMMALVTIDVILRFVFNSPIPGTYDIVRFLFLGCVFLAVSYVQGLKGHINIGIALDKASNITRRFIMIFGYLIALFITGILIWYTGDEAWQTFVIKEYSMGILRIPLWPGKAVITFGLTVLFIRLFIDLLKECMGHINE